MPERDRAAYMRAYRAAQKKTRPTKSYALDPVGKVRASLVAEHAKPNPIYERFSGVRLAGKVRGFGTDGGEITADEQMDTPIATKRTPVYEAQFISAEPKRLSSPGVKGFAIDGAEITAEHQQTSRQANITKKRK